MPRSMQANKLDGEDGNDLSKMRPDDIRYLALGIPDHMLEAMIDYRDRGVPVGDFLQAVFANDLLEAAGRADDTNKYLLDKYAMFLYNEMPRGAIGSRAAYKDWLARGEAFQAFERKNK